MEFADGRCCFCGAGFGKKKPKEVTEVDKPYTNQYGRVVQLVAPCPSCGEKIPLWAGAGALPGPEPEPAAESAEPIT